MLLLFEMVLEVSPYCNRYYAVKIRGGWCESIAEKLRGYVIAV